LVSLAYMPPSGQAGHMLARLRAARPLVQCATNYVSMDLVANVLLALGAAPVMASAPEEADDFAARANAAVCNIGTLSADRVANLEATADAAQRHGKPWALDPVGVGASQFRDATAVRLLTRAPVAIRGNPSEIIALARAAGVGTEDGAPRGIDATHAPAAATKAAIALATRQRCVVIASGQVDEITDGRRIARLANGAPMMARVTAMGCALSATVAAFLSLGEDPLAACAAALATFGVAGEIAAADGDRAVGPGAFRARFIDAIFALTPEDLDRRARFLGANEG
jgi:hydroxyethylthiazole kinase